MPPKKAKAKPKPAGKRAPKIDRYAYLPTDLQRAAVHMDRADFLRQLQKSQHDRECQARLCAAWRPAAERARR